MRLLRVLATVAVMFTTALYVIPVTASAGASGTYSCPGGWSRSGSQCTRVTTDTPHQRLWIPATYTPAPTTTTPSSSTGGVVTPILPTGTNTGTGTVTGTCTAGQISVTTGAATQCQPPAVTKTGTSYSYSNTFYCPSSSFFAGQSAVYSANATTPGAAQTTVTNEGNAWIALFCYNYQANATATATSANGTVCPGAASETSPVSLLAAQQAAQAAAQTMADVACGVTPGSGTFHAIEWRSFSGAVSVPYTGCVGGVLVPGQLFTQTGTSPLERGSAYGTTQLQANSNAAAAAVAKGLANVTATVDAAAASLNQTAATCSGTLTSSTTPTTTPTYTAPTTTTAPTSTTTAVQNIWLPIVAVVNRAHAVVVNPNITIRVLLVPLTQVAATPPTLVTINPTTDATTPGCTPTENAQGSYTLPNCSISGGVGDSVIFNFQSNTGLAVNSVSFTIPATTSTTTSGYTCPYGGHLDTTGTSCVTSSSYAASHVQTGSTPIYANGYTCPSGGHLDASGTNCVTTSSTPATYAKTGSTPIYAYEQTGSTPIYANVQTGSYPIYTYEQTGSRPIYGIVGGGGWYAIRGCVAHNRWGNCIWGTVGYGRNPYVYGVTGYSPTYGEVRTGTGYTYTYEQTGATPIYGYVQTGSTPIYGYTCPSGGNLDASGTNCVTTSSTPATYATVFKAMVWNSGIGPNFHVDG